MQPKSPKRKRTTKKPTKTKREKINTVKLKTSKTTETFHPFSKLPAELQLENKYAANEWCGSMLDIEDSLYTRSNFLW